MKGTNKMTEDLQNVDLKELTLRMDELKDAKARLDFELKQVDKEIENNIAKANCNKLNIGEYEEKQKQIYKQIIFNRRVGHFKSVIRLSGTYNRQNAITKHIDTPAALHTAIRRSRNSFLALFHRIWSLHLPITGNRATEAIEVSTRAYGVDTWRM